MSIVTVYCTFNYRDGTKPPLPLLPYRRMPFTGRGIDLIGRELRDGRITTRLLL